MNGVQPVGDSLPVRRSHQGLHELVQRILISLLRLRRPGRLRRQPGLPNRASSVKHRRGFYATHRPLTPRGNARIGRAASRASYDPSPPKPDRDRWPKIVLALRLATEDNGSRDGFFGNL